MKKIITILLFSLIIGCSNNSTEKYKIINIFNDFNTANIESNGEKIYQLSDNESHEYYKDLLNKIKMLDSLEVIKLNLGDKINLLSVRSVLPNNIIKKMSPKDLMIAMYSKVNTMDTVKINNIKKMRIRNIRINNDTAYGNLAINNRIIQPNIEIKFTKEDGNWKYSIISTFNFVNKQMKSMCEQNGLSEMELIELIFSDPNVQNKKLKKLNEIWNSIN